MPFLYDFIFSWRSYLDPFFINLIFIVLITNFSDRTVQSFSKWSTSCGDRSVPFVLLCRHLSRELPYSCSRLKRLLLRPTEKQLFQAIILGIPFTYFPLWVLCFLDLKPLNTCYCLYFGGARPLVAPENRIGGKTYKALNVWKYICSVVYFKLPGWTIRGGSYVPSYTWRFCFTVFQLPRLRSFY